MKVTHTFSLLTLCLGICFFSCQTPENQPEEQKTMFKWVTIGRIATDGSLSRGVAWGDYDGDGDPDLYVSNSDGQWNFLYRNDGKGQFKKITAHANQASETVIYGGNSQGVNWVDFDNDNDLDLFVVSRTEEPNLLFRNDSLTKFVRITDSPLTASGISASMACWVDFDKDGDLDVFLAGYAHPNMLFKNNGNGNFEEITNTVISSNTEGRARACACADVNEDGLPEIYVANARRPNFYFKNQGNWQFESTSEGHLVEDVGYSYGVSWADYDNDGDLDLFVANFDKENVLYNNDGNGLFTPTTDNALVLEQGGASKGHAWGDYDNDGDIDLFIANGTYGPNMENFLYLNRGDGTFEKHLNEEIVKHADTSAGAAHADYDRDGDLDIFVANWGGRDQINRLYENLTSENNWVSLKLIGRTSNSFAIGAKVKLYLSNDGSRKQLHRWLYPVTGYGSQNDYELHFGLGKYTTIDSLEIYWPSEIVDIHKRIAINTHWLAIEEGEIRTIR